MPWLLTRKQVIELTGLDKRALARHVQEGLLHRHRLGRKGRYYKSELMRMVRVEK